MKYFMHITWLCLFTLHLKAQTKSVSQTDTLREITIHSKKKIKNQTANQVIDSSILHQHKNESIKTILQLYSNVFVKNYGVSGLSTISIRGSSAAQSQVYWNGVSINNALTGITDLSNMPVALFDKMEIAYGSSETDAIGGGIHLLSTQPNFNSDFKAELAINYQTLKNVNTSGRLDIGKRNFHNTFKFSLQHDKNHFTFFNPDKDKQDTLNHALQKQYALLNDFNLRINHKSTFSMHSWIQYNFREIPAATFEPASSKYENINSFKNILQYNLLHNSRLNLKSTLGILSEKYIYHDSIISLKSQFLHYSIPFNTSLSYHINTTQTLQSDFLFNHNQLTLPTHNSLTRGGIRLIYKTNSIATLPLKLKTSFLFEFSNVFKTPPALELSLSYPLFSIFELSSSLSTRYRMPTLNELYYNPGGNVNLKPESSKNAELGINITKQETRTRIHGNCTVYRRLVDNWIVWYGNSILTPHNIQQVLSRGLEVNLNYTFLFRTSSTAEKNIRKPLPQISLQTLYAYTLSTTRQSVIPNDYSINKQLPYIPRYQFKLVAGFKNSTWSSQAIYTYTGYRFVTTDESQWLLPYHYTALHFGYKHHLKNFVESIEFRFKINNLLNTSYSSIVGRMMPTRHLNFEILLIH